jgi:hypothetical protein
MVDLSVIAWLMIFVFWLEGSRYSALRNATHTLAEVLCSFADALGRQTFRFGLLGCFIDDFTDGILSGVETLGCSGLSPSLDRSAGIANQVILNVGTG